MSGIAGAVVLYHPNEIELVANIRSYLDHIERLIVIDNTEGSQHRNQEIIHQFGGRISYRAFGENLGVAAALNEAARQAYDQGYTWLLTMDQDSWFEKEQAAHYFSWFEQLFLNQERVAVVAPSHGSHTGRDEAVPKYAEVASVITSGSLVQLRYWRELNGFEEKLFIDELDHEYCYRARSRGYAVVQFYNVSLNHQLGKSRKTGYFGRFGVRDRTIHNPRRLYFIVRNYLYVRNKYRRSEREEFKKRDRLVRTAVKNNLLFSGKFMVSLKSILKGYRDYKRGNFSARIEYSDRSVL